MTLNRRDFTKTLAAGLGATAALTAAPERKLKIGHTCITWGSFPRNAESSATLEAAVRDISSLGFWGFETFPEILEDWDSRGELTKLIEKYKLPLTSGYIGTQLTDPTKKKESLEKTIRLARVIKKFGGRFAVLAPNSVKRAEYNFQDYRSNIIATLNEHATAVVDQGLGTGLHQHTGTCIESRDEVYAVMEKANKDLKFAPDVGQLQKGGSDAVKVVKDFLPLLRHMHLKDYLGGEHWVGYCPLGQGKVDIPAILDMAEAGGQNPNIMVELDPSANAPMTPIDTAKTAKAYLQKLGYTFRA